MTDHFMPTQPCELVIVWAFWCVCILYMKKLTQRGYKVLTKVN